MARTKGSFNNPNSFEVAVSAPLDARQRVSLDADLTNLATWITGGMDYSFEGMLTYSEESKSFWVLTALPATVKANWKQIGSGGSGDPTEVYKTTSTLTAAIEGTTTIGVASVSKQISDIFVDRTLIYDADGTVGVVTAISGNNITVTTVTVSPVHRQGVRLGAVNTEADLPTTVTAAEVLGFPTPLTGDYVNVRKDSTHDNKLAEYLVQVIDNSGNITWAFDHVLNDSDYQEQSKTTDAGKILTGGTQQGTFGTSIDPNDFIKGVQFNGNDLTKDTNNKVNVQAVASISIEGSPQLPDAQGNVNLPNYVKTVSIDGTNVPKDANGNVDLTIPDKSVKTWIIKLNSKDYSVKPESSEVVQLADISKITSAGQNVTVKSFSDNVVLNKDYVIIHGTDNTDATDEYVALVSAIDSTTVTLNILFNTGKSTGGGGGDAELTEKITSNIAVGAAPANTEFAKGLSFTDFAKKILVTELAPTVTFSATNSGVKEVGTSQTCTMTLSVTAMGTAKELTEVEFYVGSTLAQTVPYTSSTIFTYTHSSAITTNTTVKAILKYKKSDSSNATIEKTATYTFVKASYYGIFDPTGTVTEAVVKGLTKDIRSARGKTVNNITTNFQRIIFAYPASFGNLTSIKDGNGFSNFDSYERQSLTFADGTAYNVYVLKTPMTTTNATQIYA